MLSVSAKIPVLVEFGEENFPTSRCTIAARLTFARKFGRWRHQSKQK